MIFYPIGKTDACLHATRILARQGIGLTDHPSPDVTHLLLDVPSFRPDGQLRQGGYIEPLLRMLPPKVHIIGGNLTSTAAENCSHTDLLADPFYLAENASITADCALRLAGTHMDMTFAGNPALVIGWGRIGKCLAQKLKALGCQVTVAARKETDRAMLRALGYRAVPVTSLSALPVPGMPVFNTVPYPLEVEIPEGCVALELASVPGLSRGNILDGRGLPGRLAPRTSGKLIAETILRKIQEESL